MYDIPPKKSRNPIIKGMNAVQSKLEVGSSLGRRRSTSELCGTGDVPTEFQRALFLGT